MTHHIYKITNLMNGKYYFGQTVNPKKRWREHKLAAKNIGDDRPTQLIHRAMSKYGIKNFTFEVIETCQTLDEANRLEEAYIAKHQTNKRGRGYNIMPGGNNAMGWKMPKQSIRLGEKNPMSKLTTKQVLRAVSLYKRGDMSLRDIARTIGMSNTVLSPIIRGKTWSHITGFKRGQNPSRMNRGELNANSKLTVRLVKQIVQLSKKGKKHKEIADKLGVGVKGVSGVLGGYTWTHITNIKPGRGVKRGSKHQNSILTEKQVMRAVSLSKKDMTPTQIGRKLGILPDTIRSILSGRNWSHLTGIKRRR